MSDSFEIGSAAGGRADDWERRLLRRATAPVGLIDVKHSERLATRLAPWIRERLGLLADWRARYALDLSESAPDATSRTLAFAGAVPALSTAGATSPSAGAPTAAPATPGVRAREDRESPASFRLKRNQSGAEFAAERAAPPRSASPGGAPEEKRAPVPSPGAQDQPQPPTIRVARAPRRAFTDPELPHIFPDKANAPAELRDAPPTASDPTAEARGAGMTAPGPFADASEGDLRAARLDDAPDVPLVVPLRMEPASTSSPELPLPAAAPVVKTGPSAPEEPPVYPAESSFVARSLREPDPNSEHPMPAVVAAAPPPPIPNGSVEAPLPLRAAILDRPGKADTTVSAIAREVGGSPRPSAAVRMVWSAPPVTAAAATAQPAAMASTPTIAQSDGLSPFAPALAGQAAGVIASQTSNAAAPEQQMDALRPARIAERVSRILARELLIERERRGRAR